MLSLVCLGWLCASHVLAAERDEVRVVVSIGSNVGLAGEEALEYAENDAKRFHQLALELGGVDKERAYLLTGKTGEQVLRVLAEVRGRLEELASRGPTSLILYASAHGDEQSLHLSGTRLSFADLRASLSRMPTRFRLIVIDACQGRVSAHNKGGAPGPEVSIAKQVQTEGEVFITSASPGEPAQEWTYLRGALFTHHFLTALRGAADFDRDGNISLTEAYSYTYRRTLVDAARASQTPQRPAFSFRFRGVGDWVVTRPAILDAAIVLSPELAGRFLVVDRESELVVDLNKQAGRAVRLALRPGWYRVVHPGPSQVQASDLQLSWGGSRELRRSDFVRVRKWRTRLLGPSPIVLRPRRLRVGYALSSGAVTGLDRAHLLELVGQWVRGPGFAHAALGGTMGEFEASDLKVTHRELRGRLGGGVNADFDSTLR